MPTLTINGRQVSVDDSFLSLSREEQDATVEEIAHSVPKPEASGAMAGAQHGVAQVAHGIAETGKMLGVGNGFDNRDPNYVPADPRKPSEWGQLIAENTPAMGAAIGTGAVARKILPGKYGKLAGLAGAGLAGWLMSAGDTAKERAVNRTGDANAEANTEDKLIGSGTAAVANAAGAIAPARLIPGATTAGVPTLLNAAKRYLGTAAAGAGGNAAADAITQAGTTAGTDKGLTVDPSRVGDAAITGGVTSATFGAPQLAGDTARAASLRQHTSSPENLAATKAVATRLQNVGGDDLGAAWKGASKDFNANEVVKSDITNELSDAARNVRQQVKLSPDADNALQRAQKHEPITAKDVELITKETAAAPDGQNAAFLARQVHMQQLMNEKGSYKNGKWAGGMSGTLDANLGYMLNPTRIAGGAVASSLFGMHLLGTSNPLFAGSVAGAYGLTRAVDSLTGMRSPAKTFAQHFADRNATLRLPTAPQGNSGPPATTSVPQVQQYAPKQPWGPQQPPQLPGGTAQGPWGPKPLAQNAVPQVAPPAAPAAPAPAPATAPPISPIALKMLAQKLKAGLPAEEAPVAPEATAPAPEPQIDPLNLPTSITKSAKNLMGGHKVVQEIREKEQAKTAVSQLQSPLVEDAPLDVTQNPMVGKRASQLVSAANALRKYTGADVAEREQAQAEAQAAREEKAAAKEEQRAQRDAERKAEKEKSATERAQAIAARAKLKADAAAAKAEQVAQREAHKAELAQAKAAAKDATDKVKAAAAKVKAPKAAPEAPKAAPAEADVPYEPLAEEHLYPRGITPKEYAMREAASKGTRSETYMAKAEASEHRRQTIASELKTKHPQAARAIDWLSRELQRVGINPKEVARAVRYAQDNVPDDVAKSLEAFIK